MTMLKLLLTSHILDLPLFVVPSSPARNECFAAAADLVVHNHKVRLNEGERSFTECWERRVLLVVVFAVLKADCSKRFSISTMSRLHM
jgi:hypothetical protein